MLLSSGHMRRGPGPTGRRARPRASRSIGRRTPRRSAAAAAALPAAGHAPELQGAPQGPEFYTLDSTPIVGPDVAYCAAIGYADGRSLCPVRTEGTVDRVACENWRVGTAKDTGRPGPTWAKADGSYCTGPDSGCQNHPDSQYQLFTYRSGTYTVTAENGASCTVSH